MSLRIIDSADNKIVIVDQRFAVDDDRAQLGASCHTRGCRGTRISADNLQRLPLK
jgi:hypothetical protein